MNKPLPCPFCGGDALELGDGFYCCAEDDCAGASLDCTAEQWNTRHAPEGWQLVPVVATAMMQIESGYPADNFNERYAALLLSAPKWGDE